MNDENVLNINFAILGPISAGKSTILNSLFSATLSNMNKKATTMNPQIYKIKSNSSVKSFEEIHSENSKINNELQKLRAEKKLTASLMKENTFEMKEIKDFITKYKNYTILDMPGLNDAETEDIYYEYLQSKSILIDAYILVFDLNSGLDTTGDMKILQFVKDLIVKNKNGIVYIIINKCDNIEFDDDMEFNFTTDEDAELYSQMEKKINDTLNGYCKYCISPLCSNQMYVYRLIKFNKESAIDESHLDTIIKQECGKNELKKLNTLEKKKKFVDGMMSGKSEIYESNMVACGYTLLLNNLGKLLDNNYPEILKFHIDMKINSIAKANFPKIIGTILNPEKNIWSIINDYDMFQQYSKDSKFAFNEILLLEVLLENILQYCNLNNNIDGTIDLLSHIKKNSYKHPIWKTIQIHLLDYRKKILEKYIKESFDLNNLKLLFDLNEKITKENINIGLANYFRNSDYNIKEIIMFFIQYADNFIDIYDSELIFSNIFNECFNDKITMLMVSNIATKIKNNEVMYIIDSLKLSSLQQNYDNYKKIFSEFNEMVFLIDEYYEVKNKTRDPQPIKSFKVAKSNKKQIKKEVIEDELCDEESEMVYKSAMKNASDRATKYMNS